MTGSLDNRLTLTVPAAAAALGVSRTTIYDAIKAGTMASMIFLGRRVIRVETIRALIDQAEAASVACAARKTPQRSAKSAPAVARKALNIADTSFSASRRTGSPAQ
jgi:excisionase family DNA binding protein